MLVTRRALHLLFTVAVLCSVLLYGPAVALATEGAEARATDSASAPHIALLLPLDFEAFARAADAVRSGFLEAAKKHSGTPLPVRVYAVSEDTRSIISSYRKAIGAGASVVVGPLTRNGVTALARSPNVITVPTLALNVIEPAGTQSGRFFGLSLQIEAEARQVAQLALSEGRRKAFTVSDATPLAKRMREAFIAEFERGGGHHIADYPYTTDSAGLERMRQASSLKVADMVFFAVDAPRMRTVRPHMPGLTGYGTSQVNPGTSTGVAAADLADVRFVDMPWMVQPDHPAVMVYARRDPRESDDLERLYALGIDAFRIAAELGAGRREIDLDGVTGRLQLGPDGVFRRGLLVTLIDGGRLTVLGEAR